MSLRSDVVWEVRKTGADDNGGGFDPIPAFGPILVLGLNTPGTDYQEDDELTLVPPPNGGGEGVATVIVDSVDAGGGILTWHLSSPGVQYGLYSCTVTGGSGNDDAIFDVLAVSPGTDYSQQDSAQLSLADGATTGGSTYLTSVTGGFTTAMRGNILYIASGTNANVGYYEIMEVIDTNGVVLDRQIDNGSAASDIVLKVGGALDHPNRVSGDLITDSTAKMWVKKGVYTYLANGIAAVADDRYITELEGYNVTRGDNPTNEYDMPQFDADHSGSYGVYAQYGPVANCVGYNANSQGIFVIAGQAINCVGHHNAASGVYTSGNSAIDCVGYNNGAEGVFSTYLAIGCEGYNNATNGVTATMLAIDCVGFNDVNNGVVSSQSAINCLALYEVTGIDAPSLLNCIGYKNLMASLVTSGGGIFNSIASENTKLLLIDTITNPGQDYLVGDIVTFVGGDGKAKAIITQVGSNGASGQVLELFMTVNGIGYADGDYNVTGGTGTGLIVNLTSTVGTGFYNPGSIYGFDYNCYYGNGVDLYQITAGDHDVAADPLFVNPEGTLISDCETAWNEYVGTGVTATATDGVYKVGTKSAKAACDGTTGVERIMTKAITPTNMSTYRGVHFWLYSNVALDAGDLQFLIDEHASCVSPLKTLDLPAILPYVWTKVVLNCGDLSGCTSIISIGLNKTVDEGAIDVYIDDVRGMDFDFRLQAASPCLNAGIPRSPMGGVII